MKISKDKSTGLLKRRKLLYYFIKTVAILLIANTILMFLATEYLQNYKNYETMEMGFEYIELNINSKIRYLKSLSTIYSSQISDMVTNIGNKLATDETDPDYETEFNILSSLILSNELDSVTSSAAFQIINVDFGNGNNLNSKLIMANRIIDGVLTKTIITGPDYLEYEQDNIDYSQYPLEGEVLNSLMNIGEINSINSDMNDYIYYHRGYDSANQRKYTIFASPIFYDGTVVGTTGIVVEDSFFLKNIELNMINKNMPLSDVHFVFSKYENGRFILDETSMLINKDKITPIHDKSINMVKHSTLNSYSNGRNTYYGFDSKIDILNSNSYFKIPEWRVLLLIDSRLQIFTIHFFEIILFLALIIGTFFYFRLSKKVMDSIVITDDDNVNNLMKLALTREDNFIEIENKINGGTNIISKKELVVGIQSLSQSEYRVFSLYCEGYTPKEVSELLYLSINTVKSHNRKIYEKLLVKSRDELLDLIDKLELNSKKVGE